jgi:transcription antitermination factor NusG
MKQVVMIPETRQTPWYAVQTRWNFEARVHQSLRRCAIDDLYPVYRTTRVRRPVKEIDRPLFPGYLFASFDLADRIRVLSIPGVFRILGDAVPEKEMEQVRLLMTCPDRMGPAAGYQPHPGDQVEIQCGPLTGLRGQIQHANQGEADCWVYIPSLFCGVPVRIDVQWLVVTDPAVS